jgi:hypothetical protein
VRRLSSRFIIHISQRTRLRIMAFITIADTGLISYVSTRNLAERWGFGTLSWLYPLCLDAVAAVVMDLWMSNSPAKRAAKWLALFAVALSLAANVVDWLYVGPGAAVLGAVPPLMLAALLLTLHRHSAHTEHTQAPAQPSTMTEQAPQTHPDTAPDTAPDTVADAMADAMVDSAVPVPAADPTDRPGQPPAEIPAPEVAGTAAPVPPPDPAPVPARRPRGNRKGPRPRVSDDVVVAALREHEQNDDPLTRRQAMDMFRMGTNRADRLLAEARNGARDGGRDEVRNGTQLDLAVLDHAPDAGPDAGPAVNS